MNNQAILFPNGLYLNLNSLSSFRLEDIDEKDFTFIYTLNGIEKEYSITLPNELKILLDQRLNYAFEIKDLNKKK